MRFPSQVSGRENIPTELLGRQHRYTSKWCSMWRTNMWPFLSGPSRQQANAVDETMLWATQVSKQLVAFSHPPTHWKTEHECEPRLVGVWCFREFPRYEEWKSQIVVLERSLHVTDALVRQECTADQWYKADWFHSDGCERSDARYFGQEGGRRENR